MNIIVKWAEPKSRLAVSCGSLISGAQAIHAAALFVVHFSSNSTERTVPGSHNKVSSCEQGLLAA